jgi:phage gp36-like protein
MPYATQDQIQLAAGGAARLVELADWNRDGAIDADVIAMAQSAADGWIDSYLRARFATPIATPSDTLVRLAADEAVYVFRQRVGMLSQSDADDRKSRETWLRDCARGVVRPDEPLPEKSTAVKSAWVDDPGRSISREGLKGGVW